jgi:plastocyanin
MPTRRLTLAALAAVALLAASCGDDDDDSSAATTTAAAAATTTVAGGATTAPAGGAKITVAGSAFSPSELTVKVGEAVTIENTDGLGHTFTADDGAFNEALDPSSSATYTPDAAGSFPYHCNIHPSMEGTLTVEA